MPYKDPEKNKECQRNWREKNKTKCREYNKDWRKRNPEKFKAILKRYYEKVKLKRIEAYQKLRLSAINLLGGECIDCGNSDERVLEFHHIKGNGNHTKGNKLYETGKKQFLHVLRSPNEFLLLCANHHRIRTRENQWNKKSMRFYYRNPK